MHKASAVTAMYPAAAGTHGRTASPSSAHTAVMHQSAAVPRRRNNRFANGQSGVGKGIIADNQQRHTDSNRGYDSQIEQGQHRGQPEQRPCPEEKRFGWQTQA